MKRFRLGHYLKTSLWVVPLLFILGGIILSFVTTSIDDGTLIPQSISGDPAAALQVLYLISFAMLTLTGLVLSLVLVVVQLAMGVFSPRIVRQILQDRPSQMAIGLFAGTFSHALLSMRAIDSTAEGGTVPGLAIVVALVLVLICIGTLVWYVNHVGQSLRVAGMVRWVADDTLAALDHVYPDHGAEQDLGRDIIATPTGGIIFAIDHEQLVAIARQAECRLEVLWTIGDFIPSGAAIVRVLDDPSSLNSRAVLNTIALGPERTLNQDPAYGIRMLVDIALRALSSGPFEDPTTAVQSIDRLHDILRQLARRPMHSGNHLDQDGELRLLVPTMQWDAYVHVAFDEIRQAGAASPQVTRRLKSAFDDLLIVALPDRRQEIENQLTLLADAVTAVPRDDRDRAEALIPDPAGIGSADRLVSGRDIGKQHE